jgi:hypothetical protein
MCSWTQSLSDASKSFQSNYNSPRFAEVIMYSDARLAMAMAVNVGFTPAQVTNALVSHTYKFLTSCV